MARRPAWHEASASWWSSSSRHRRAEQVGDERSATRPTAGGGIGPAAALGGGRRRSRAAWRWWSSSASPSSRSSSTGRTGRRRGGRGVGASWSWCRLGRAPRPRSSEPGTRARPRARKDTAHRRHRKSRAPKLRGRGTIGHGAPLLAAVRPFDPNATGRASVSRTTNWSCGSIEVSLKGIHDPATCRSALPWTDKPSPLFERNSIQHYWQQPGRAHAERMAHPLRRPGRRRGRRRAGRRRARTSPRRRVASTGSWLGQAFQGQGIGKEMRAAVLHFLSPASTPSAASAARGTTTRRRSACRARWATSRTARRSRLRRDERDRQIRLLLTREEWEKRAA